MGILRTALLKGSQSPWLARQVTDRKFTRRAVHRFMPGETAEDALAAAQALHERGIGTVLTLLGENVEDMAEARDVTRHYLDVLDDIARRALPCHLSVKLTQLGLDADRAACEEQVRRLLADAAERGTFVWIDMEGSPYTDVTLEIYRSVRAAHANVGVCLQAYLYRTPQDLDGLASLHPVIRLVKGAYREPATIAHPRKQDVDECYFRLAQRLLAQPAAPNGATPGIATHDPALIARIRAHADAAGIARDAYEFQMLYGIRRDEQRSLAAEGHRVRVLISYGSAWFPWYMRRLAERPANLWFVVRSIVGG
jgi:proline dehydrogenase